MLETIAACAAEHLALSGDEATHRAAHAAWFLTLAETAKQDHEGTDPRLVLDRLETEQDNLRAALRWAIAQGAAGAMTALTLAIVLFEFWWPRGHLAEADAWLTQALERVDEAPVELRVEAFAHAGWIAAERGDYGRATRLGDAALALARQLPESSLVAEVLIMRGGIAGMDGQPERELEFVQEALELYERLGDRRGIAMAANNVAIVGWQQGHPPWASDRLEQALAIYEEFGDVSGITMVQSNLGLIALRRGDPWRAAEHAQHSLRLAWEIGDQRGIAMNLTIVVGIAHAAGLLGAEARLFAAAARVRDRMGMVYEAWERPEIEAQQAALVVALGEATFQQEWRTGQGMSLAEVVTAAMATLTDVLARNLDTAPARVPQSSVPRLDLAEGPGSDLTRREREILTLLCQRYTDLEIAKALFISPHTASKHVSNILGKLGAANRREAAAIAARSALI